MSANEPLRVVICWHMHQPQYANRLNGEYQLPWTYLHAIKDYTDMAAHLQAVPQARAVVNFAPILLEQLDDYAQQIDSHLKTGQVIRDPLLSALASAVLPHHVEQRLSIMKSCLRANKERLIKRFQPYHRLVDMAMWFAEHPEADIYISDQLLVDLLVWYHLAWLGESLRRQDERVKHLMAKACGFTFHDRRVLLQIIGEAIAAVFDSYKHLAANGQVELSMTPYAHPIVPLLLDIHSAKQAMPDVALPFMETYPGGEERVQWHIQQGLQTFQRYLGVTPQGCWPSEGGVSDAAIDLFEQAGFRWIASGENVIRNSLNLHDRPSQSIYQAFSLQQGRLACFFRDDGLSDLVGFSYSNWHADDAVANLIYHLENIADKAKHDTHNTVVSIILDGENAWEYYPENGYYFLSALYQQLTQHPKLQLTTFSECLNQNVSIQSLPGFVAGSWVHGTFSTWIGDADKNRAWDLLGEAKRCFDNAVQAGRLSEDQHLAAQQQLAICEGSDWFWWFGDYNPADVVSDFERLYRMQLVNLYQILGEEPPEHLAHVFAHGTGDPAASGVMRHGSELN